MRGLTQNRSILLFRADRSNCILRRTIPEGYSCKKGSAAIFDRPVNDPYCPESGKDLISSGVGDLALVTVFPSDVYLLDTIADKTDVR